MLGSRKKTAKEIPANVRYLPAGSIVPNPRQPRKRFDQEGILRLADSINRHGLLQPLCVRPLGRDRGYELISGERRLRACLLLGMESIPCVLMEKVDREESARLAVIENLQREDLDVFDQAQAMKELLESGGIDREELCRILSLSPGAVSNKLRLLKLNSRQRGIITDNGLTERHARAVLRIESDSARSFILSKIAELELSVKDSEALVAQYLRDPKGTTEKLSSPPRANGSKPIRKLVLKDVRIFINSVDKALKLVKESGIDVKADKIDESDHVEYVIRVPKITA